MFDRLHSEVTDAIICCFYNVYNKLGYGFLEKVYEKAMVIETTQLRLCSVAQSPVTVHFDGHKVGEYFCDLLVEEKVIVEIKATKELSLQHEAQLLNYLKATEIEVGLLLNFGPKPEVRRRVFPNDKKNNGTLIIAEKAGLNLSQEHGYSLDQRKS